MSENKKKSGAACRTAKLLKHKQNEKVIPVIPKPNHFGFTTKGSQLEIGKDLSKDYELNLRSTEAIIKSLHRW